MYSNPGAFHDVTKGTNAIAPNVPGYTAGPGWDACTGLGTPDGKAMLKLLMPAHAAAQAGHS